MKSSMLVAPVVAALISTILTPCVLAQERLPQEVQQALESFEKGDYDTVLKIFSKRADDGDVKAMLMLGVWFSEGKVFKRDYSKAMHLFLRAFEKGDLAAGKEDLIAGLHIAIMHRDGEGVPQDLELAYALAAICLRKAALTATREADEVLRFGNGVMERTIMLITAEQLARGEAMAKRQWTADDLRKHKPEASAARQQIRLLPAGCLERLPKRYVLDADQNRRAYASVRISELNEDKTEAFGPRKEAFSSIPVDNPEQFVRDGIYRSELGRFAIRVPKLSSDEIKVHQSTLWPAAGVPVYQVRFMEDSRWLFDAASVDRKASWHAVVETLRVPPEMKGKEFARIDELQKEYTADLPTEFNLTILEGSLGRAFQTVVANRVASKKYPQTKVSLAPPCYGLKTIGINRLFLQDDDILVELGIIVPKPPEMSAEEFVRYALAQMDVCMSGFKLLPRR